MNPNYKDMFSASIHTHTASRDKLTESASITNRGDILIERSMTELDASIVKYNSHDINQ